MDLKTDTLIKSAYERFIFETEKLVSMKINDEYLLVRGIVIGDGILSFVSILTKDIEEYTKEELLVYSKLLLNYKSYTTDYSNLIHDIIIDIIKDSWIFIRYIGNDSYYICDNKNMINSNGIAGQRLFINKGKCIDESDEFCKHLIYENIDNYNMSCVSEIIDKIKTLFMSVNKNSKKVTTYSIFGYPVFEDEYTLDMWLSKFDTTQRYNINLLTFRKNRHISLMDDGGNQWLVDDNMVVRADNATSKVNKGTCILKKYTEPLPKELLDKATDTPRQYFSPRGNMLAYFGEPPEGEMSYIVVELSTKWYTFYEIDSNGNVKKSELANNQMLIGYLDNTWDPSDLKEFIDNNENEFWIPELSMELFVGRWELESTDHYR